MNQSEQIKIFLKLKNLELRRFKRAFKNLLNSHAKNLSGGIKYYKLDIPSPEDGGKWTLGCSKGLLACSIIQDCKDMDANGDWDGENRYDLTAQDILELNEED